MELDLTGKNAVVTGASKGIGAGVAVALAEAGAAVVVNYHKDKAGAEKVVEQIKAAGGRVLAVKADVSKSTEVATLFEIARQEFGNLHIVVNNAGVFPYGDMASISEQEFYDRFGTNVLSTILTTQQALKHFPESGGSIVNIGSGASQRPSANNSLYASTKGATDVLGRAFAG